MFYGGASFRPGLEYYHSSNEQGVIPQSGYASSTCSELTTTRVLLTSELDPEMSLIKVNAVAKHRHFLE
jgi:hypothetical protein